MFLRPCNYVNNDDSGTNRHRAFGKKYVFSSIPSVLAWPRQRGGSKLRSCRDFSSLHFSPGKKSARPMPGIVFRIFKGIARVEIAVVDLLPGLCFWREAPEPTVGPDRTGGRENGGLWRHRPPAFYASTAPTAVTNASSPSPAKAATSAPPAINAASAKPPIGSPPPYATKSRYLS